jgi:predicted N-acetyltransferase YhbS
MTERTRALSQVSVRAATEGDLDAIAAITRATGQHEDWAGSNPAYVTHLMRRGRVLVASRGAGVIGFGAVQQIGTGSAGISMLCDLFVDPAVHGGGAGRAMLAELWRAAPRRMTFSSQHSHAIPLYTSFGLDAWWPLLYLHGDVAALAMPGGWSVQPVTADQAGQLELSWTGIDRTEDHRAWAGRPNGAALTASRDGRVLAAGTVGGPAGEFGVTHLALSPAAADSAAAAVLAVLAGLPAPGPAARVCLPGPHPAVRALLAAGWRIDDIDQFMATEPGLLDPRRAVPSPGQA